jgi:hypothetical protein
MEHRNHAMITKKWTWRQKGRPPICGQPFFDGLLMCGAGSSGSRVLSGYTSSQMSASPPQWLHTA